jgi:hypothetical protein
VARQERREGTWIFRGVFAGANEIVPGIVDAWLRHVEAVPRHLDGEDGWDRLAEWIVNGISDEAT